MVRLQLRLLLAVMALPPQLLPPVDTVLRHQNLLQEDTVLRRLNQPQEDMELRLHAPQHPPPVDTAHHHQSLPPVDTAHRLPQLEVTGLRPVVKRLRSVLRPLSGKQLNGGTG